MWHIVAKISWRFLAMVGTMILVILCILFLKQSRVSDIISLNSKEIRLRIALYAI